MKKHLKWCLDTLERPCHPECPVPERASTVLPPSPRIRGATEGRQHKLRAIGTGCIEGDTGSSTQHDTIFKRTPGLCYAVDMDSNLTDLEKNIEKTIAHLKSEFAKLQTGRATTALVENVLVDSYGQKQPLKALAGISIQDVRTIAIQPWDKGTLGDIEKALQQANVGATPVNDGVMLRIVLPPMTEERRTQLSKIAHELAEEAHISVRQQRQEVHTNVKKDESRTKDEHRDFELAVQEVVDKANKEIEELAEKKEKDVMTV